MANLIKQLADNNLLQQPPHFLADGTQFLVIMGSVAYGVSNDSSDMDVYGFAIPPKDIMFPQERGEIPGFDPYETQFHQFQQHHIVDQSALGGKGRNYDLSVYSIAKYFRLLMENNPNIIDSLFVPDNCILYSTPIADTVRENRKLFLHKGCWAKFKGYAYSQLHKIRTKKPVGNRKKNIEEFGYDVKFAYHVVRLLDEVEQLLTTGELNLSRNREQLKAIRRGDWKLEQVEEHFKQKESQLEAAYAKSDLPDKPDTVSIRKLLSQCLESYYGSLTSLVTPQDVSKTVLKKIAAIIKQAGVIPD